MPVVDSVPVQLKGDVVKGPDGQPWIRYEWSLGLTVMTMVVPVGTAKQIPALVADVTAQTLAQAPTTSGLLLPPGAGGVLVPRPIRDNPQA